MSGVTEGSSGMWKDRSASLFRDKESDGWRCRHNDPSKRRAVTRKTRIQMFDVTLVSILHHHQ